LSGNGGHQHRTESELALALDEPFAPVFEQLKFLSTKFNASSTRFESLAGWNTVNFQVAPSVLQPITLQGGADTQFEFTSGAARAPR
jgi:hypothetical protein